EVPKPEEHLPLRLKPDNGSWDKTVETRRDSCSSEAPPDDPDELQLQGLPVAAFWRTVGRQQRSTTQTYAQLRV
ncbi:hypothetical protein AMECASPLE_026459, partial [Ameca splendens]